MCKLRGTIWYIIHANRMLLKIWPHLTFGWPFVNISLSIHPSHSKLYIFVLLVTSRVIWYTWKAIWNILKFWPALDLCVTLPNRPKFCQNIFWRITTSKLSITHFPENGTWVRTSSTTVFNCCRLVRRGILKATFWYLKDLYRTFMCKVKIEKTESRYTQNWTENNKMAAMMDFGGHFGIIKTYNWELFNWKCWFKSLFVFEILKSKLFVIIGCILFVRQI